MKRFLLFALLMAGTLAWAAPVGRQEARQVAENFWHSRAPKELRSQELKDVSEAAGFRGVYLFAADEGFVIVAGSNLVRPILGYGYGEPFQVDNQPVQIADWMEDYASVMEQMEIDKVAQDAAVGEAWAMWLSGGRKPSKEGVAPLLATRWDQGYPYNLLCPFDSARRTRTVTGCVATAMAQVLKYWEYPIVGKGHHSYVSTYGTLNVDFRETTYDWENMPNQSFTDADQRMAVATLMYHCGVAVDMGYGVGATGGSGAFVCDAPAGHNNVVNALISHFDYQSSLNCRHRSSYNDEAWGELLSNELQAGRPIIYSGSDPSAGHCFVLDGVDDEMMFHINWGWSGGYNGYYAVGTFNPGGGGTGSNSTYTFNLNNSAVIGIVPNGVLKCNPERVSVGELGGVGVTVVSSSRLSNDVWVLSNDAEWIHFESVMGSGMGDTTLVYFVVDSNETGENRSASVVFRQGEELVTMFIEQNECGIVDSFPYMESFEDALFCWTYLSVDGANVNSMGISDGSGDAYDGSNYFTFGSPIAAANYEQYLISPPLEMGSDGFISFSYKRLYSNVETLDVLASETDSRLSSFGEPLKTVTTKKVGWQSLLVDLPQSTRYVALRYRSENQRSMAIDDIYIFAQNPAHPVVEPDTVPADTVAIDTIATDTVVVSIRNARSIEGRMWVEGHRLVVVGYGGQSMMVFDLLGRCIYARKTIENSVQIDLPERGIYMVKIGDYAPRKIVVSQ